MKNFFILLMTAVITTSALSLGAALGSEDDLNVWNLIQASLIPINIGVILFWANIDN